MTQISEKPYSAPARVLCTKWDTPTAAPAYMSPGPKVRSAVLNRFSLSIIAQK